MIPSLLGGSWGHVGLFFAIFRIFSAFVGCLDSCWFFFSFISSDFFLIFERFGEGFGRILGGFGKDFGKLLERILSRFFRGFYYHFEREVNHFIDKL